MKDCELSLLSVLALTLHTGLVWAIARRKELSKLAAWQTASSSSTRIYT